LPRLGFCVHITCDSIQGVRIERIMN